MKFVRPVFQKPCTASDTISMSPLRTSPVASFLWLLLPVRCRNLTSDSEHQKRHSRHSISLFPLQSKVNKLASRARQAHNSEAPFMCSARIAVCAIARVFLISPRPSPLLASPHPGNNTLFSTHQPRRRLDLIHETLANRVLWRILTNGMTADRVPGLGRDKVGSKGVRESCRR